MIQQLISDGKTEAEIKVILIAYHGIDPITAQHMIELELGRTAGDWIRLRANGTEQAARPVIIEPKELNP